MAAKENNAVGRAMATRRTALAGIAGTLALATGAGGAVALQSASPDNPDQELIALCDRYIKEWAEYNVCLGREDDAREIAQRNRPPCPPELYETLQFEDAPKQPSHAPYSHAPHCNDRPYWSGETLAGYAKPKSTSWRNDVTHVEGVLTLKMLTFPVPEATRARCRELLAIYERWQAEIEASEDEWSRLEELGSEQSDRCSATLDEIIGHKPQTLAGVIALATVVLEGGMLDSGDSEEYSAVKRTIFEGLIRLGRGSLS